MSAERRSFQRRLAGVAIGPRTAIETCGIDRVPFGTDYGPVLISPREHVDVVERAVPDQADRDKISWKNGAEVFKLDRDA